jgi:hypothetical protein
MAEGEKRWDFSKTTSVLKASQHLKMAATNSKETLHKKPLSRDLHSLVYYSWQGILTKGEGSVQLTSSLR